MKEIIVDKNSEINTLQKAFNLLDGSETTIYVHEGVYVEKLRLEQSNVKIIGEDKNTTIISFDDCARRMLRGVRLLTVRTATLNILADNVTLENIQVRNTCGYGAEVGQGVALETMGNNIHIHNCILDACQDTLLLGPLPKDLCVRYYGFISYKETKYTTNHDVYLDNCEILGDVDFVFGCGHGIFNNCTFVSKERAGYVFAPSTEKEDEGGFEIIDSKFISDDPTPRVYLARPWRDYGKVTLKNCRYGNHIYDDGFNKWNDSSRDKTCRFVELDCSYLDNHEYKRTYFVTYQKKDC